MATSITEIWPCVARRSTSDLQRAREWAMKLLLWKVEFQVEIVGGYFDFSWNDSTNASRRL